MGGVAGGSETRRMLPERGAQKNAAPRSASTKSGAQKSAQTRKGAKKSALGRKGSTRSAPARSESEGREAQRKRHAKGPPASESAPPKNAVPKKSRQKNRGRCTARKSAKRK